MRCACHYAIIRFMPFIETGEFANVGVVLLCPEKRFFGFRLLTQRYGHVTQFFDIDARVYTEARKFFNEELSRIQNMLELGPLNSRQPCVDIKAAQDVFRELVRPREVIMRFDAPRAVLTDDPKTKLDELYLFYVERNFANKEYHERLLEKDVRGLLAQSQLGNKFTEQRIGNEDYGARFPFVQCQEDFPIKVIKPFYLGQDEPAKIRDHGGPWVDRVRRLRRHQLLPQEVLFAVQGPDQGNRKQLAAYQEICDDLEEYGITVVPVAERLKIIEFAAR
jgi:hypothetical protein